MMETVKKILAYCNWLSLIAFVTAFGIALWTKTVIGAVAVIVAAAGLFIYMMVHSSARYSPGNRISGSRPLGTPLIDIALIVFGIQGYLDGDAFPAWVIIGAVMILTDLLRWLLISLTR